MNGVETEVNGERAIVINGITGAPAQEPLLEHILSAEEAMRELALVQAEVHDAKEALEPFAVALKAANKKRDDLVERIAADYWKSEQTSLDLT